MRLDSFLHLHRRGLHTGHCHVEDGHLAPPTAGQAQRSESPGPIVTIIGIQNLGGDFQGQD